LTPGRATRSLSVERQRDFSGHGPDEAQPRTQPVILRSLVVEQATKNLSGGPTERRSLAQWLRLALGMMRRPQLRIRFFEPRPGMKALRMTAPGSDDRRLVSDSQ